MFSVFMKPLHTSWVLLLYSVEDSESFQIPRVPTGTDPHPQVLSTLPFSSDRGDRGHNNDSDGDGGPLRSQTSFQRSPCT